MRSSIRLIIPALLSLGLAACAGNARANVAPDDGVDSVSYGYGRVPRTRSAGAIVSVTPGEHDAHASRVEELLDGRVPGLQVLPTGGGNFSLRIRGITTLPGSGTNAEPLVVLDGMPLESLGLGSVLNGISPHDVQRIDVLKDAASTAIYGSRGANGVIIITSRRPR